MLKLQPPQTPGPVRWLDVGQRQLFTQKTGREQSQEEHHDSYYTRRTETDSYCRQKLPLHQHEAAASVTRRKAPWQDYRPSLALIGERPGASGPTSSPRGTYSSPQM
ncbi:hypothetical protein Pcinc_040482 [Petrolisthes cinctipes]|uniref:Uncharacterized protein n=1 Tax=Petrolisthes cinctipes TaxID=88211 RepID=A0AAE1EJH5_PETCI|nr:hypothetical protein Pcinc_040482 [Petrolisthes cinctipes]